MSNVPYCELHSDKIFWHKYIPFYEQTFAGRDFKTIAEFGLLKGDSVRWLSDRFPNASIYGADIFLQPTLPTGDKFKYFQLNQNNLQAVKSFLQEAEFDLIIEDGSHIPLHQANCMIAGINALQPGGVYILEDVHTSKNDPGSNAYNVLLAIDHYMQCGKVIDENASLTIAKNSLISSQDVLALSKNIKSIKFYRRTTLPDNCYKCGSSDFNYSTLTCPCGVELMSDGDSMSIIIEKNGK